MLSIIKQELQKIINNIDNGSCKLSQEDQKKVLESLSFFSKDTNKLSKYQSYTYLRISRSYFDTLIREGKIVKGKKEPGFKEIFWYKKDLDDYINNNK